MTPARYYDESSGRYIDCVSIFAGRALPGQGLSPAWSNTGSLCAMTRGAREERPPRTTRRHTLGPMRLARLRSDQHSMSVPQLARKYRIAKTVVSAILRGES